MSNLPFKQPPTARTWLEHNVKLNLVADRFPQGPAKPYPDEQGHG